MTAGKAKGTVVFDIDNVLVPNIDYKWHAKENPRSLLRTSNKTSDFFEEAVNSATMLMPKPLRQSFGNHLNYSIPMDREVLDAMAFVHEHGYAAVVRTSNKMPPEIARGLQIRILEECSVPVEIERVSLFGKSAKVEGKRPVLVVNDFQLEAIIEAGLFGVPQVIIDRGHQPVESVLAGFVDWLGNDSVIVAYPDRKDDVKAKIARVLGIIKSEEPGKNGKDGTNPLLRRLAGEAGAL